MLILPPRLEEDVERSKLSALTTKILSWYSKSTCQIFSHFIRKHSKISMTVSLLKSSHDSSDAPTNMSKMYLILGSQLQAVVGYLSIISDNYGPLETFCIGYE